MRKNSGFTLIELLVVVAIVAIIVAIAASAFSGVWSPKVDLDVVDAAARDHADRVGWGEVLGISPTSVDTGPNGPDGYVSVTMRTNDVVEYADDGTPLRRKVVEHHLHCGYGRRKYLFGFFGPKITGCKAAPIAGQAA